MSSSATTSLLTGAASGASCCLRSNLALFLALSALGVSLIFAGLAESAGEKTCSSGMFALAALSLLLAILAWFQRSLEKQISRFDQENDELRATKTRLDKENEELADTRRRLDQENKELAAQVKNLNKLHNDSVAMIRQLAVYGDECREFGRELSGVATDLRETDDSLGLTAEELQKQVRALSAVAGALGRVQAGESSA